MATLEVGNSILVPAQMPVEAGSQCDGSTVAALEKSVEGRVVALVENGKPRWREVGWEGSTLHHGQETLVVVTRLGLEQLTHALRAGGNTH